MEQYREAIRQIMISVNRIDGIYEMVAKRIGIKSNLLTLLYALDDGKVHTQKEICEHWCIPRTTINTIVKECVNAGLITLAAGERTKEKCICMTDRGQAYARDILTEIYAMEQRAMEQTLERYPEDFVLAVEGFAQNLKAEIDH